jgi:hypothetical protein
MMSLKTVTKLLASAAIAMLVVGHPPKLHAQSNTQSSGLVITILDGEGALNDIRQRTAREPIVEVQDENHKPVAGAAVLFTLPNSGAGGSFAGGVQTFSTVTDSAGRAVAHGLQPNNVSGSYNIHVHVSFNGASSETDIHQQNVSGQSSVAHHAGHAALGAKAITLIVVAGAVAATVATVVVTQGGGSSTVISAGPPTVGPPTTSAGIRFSLHGRSH